jgi:hypothetical protein
VEPSGLTGGGCRCKTASSAAGLMARSSSVPSSSTGGCGLNRRLRRWLASAVRARRPVGESSAATCGAEHSRKPFTSYQHLGLLLFHGLSSHPSLHQSSEPFAACTGLVAAFQHLDPSRDDHGPPTLVQLPVPGLDLPPHSPT